MNRFRAVPTEWSHGPHPVPAGQSTCPQTVPTEKNRSLYATTPGGGGVAAVRDHTYRTQNHQYINNGIEAR